MMVASTENLIEIPQSIDAEACVLASVFQAPEMFSEIRPLLRQASFFQADYGEIYATLCWLADNGRPLDVGLVRDHLISRGVYAEIGGAEALIKLLKDTVFTGAYAVHYARIVAEKAKLRALIRLASEIQAKCSQPTRLLEPSALIAKWAGECIERISDTGFQDTTRKLEQVLHDLLESKQRKDVKRIPTGLRDLDDLIGGLPIGQLTYVAGKAGMGKSQLLKQFARNVATAGVSCGIISIEETAEKIGDNYLAGESGIANNKIVCNNLGPEDWEQILSAVPNLAKLEIFIDDAQHRISDIERVARRMVRLHGCRVIGVDHLHLIDGEYEGPREQEITQISGGLKRLFKELNVVGVVAAQMNRGAAGEHEAPPELRHLRGSGSLEQDGDLILQLHRQDYYEWKKRGKDFVPDHRLRIFVNKNKAGNTGWRDAYFDGDSQTVTDWNEGRGHRHDPAVQHFPTPHLIQDPFDGM